MVVVILIQGEIAVDRNLLDNPSPCNPAVAFPTSCRVADDPVRHSRKLRCRSCLRGHDVDGRRIVAASLTMRLAAFALNRSK